MSVRKRGRKRKNSMVCEHSIISGNNYDMPIRKRTGQLLLNAIFIDTEIPIKKKLYHAFAMVIVACCMKK